MNWVFIDPLPWDYDVNTPLVRALGGSQSALCYLAKALARRGHSVATLTGTTTPSEIDGVHCYGRPHFPDEVLRRPETIVVELNGPAEIAAECRPLLPRGVPLILWTQIAHNQETMVRLGEAACRAQWDRIVCVSNWHKEAFQARLGVPPSQMDVLKNAIGPAFEKLFRDADDLVQSKSVPLRLAYTSAPFRGLDMLLLCLPELRRRHPTCGVDIFSSMQMYNVVGPQDEFEPLYAWCRATEGAVYHGSVSQSELARELRGASILAYPSTFEETSCINAMEGLAAGALVLTSELGALPETCGRFGRFISPLEPSQDLERFLADYVQALDAAMQKILAEPGAFASGQFDQVAAINASCTWDVRAVEWESAGANWLGTHG